MVTRSNRDGAVPAPAGRPYMHEHSKGRNCFPRLTIIWPPQNQSRSPCEDGDEKTWDKSDFHDCPPGLMVNSTAGLMLVPLGPRVYLEQLVLIRVGPVGFM